MTRPRLSAERQNSQNQEMQLTRSSGILLHPTSLPGPFGIGDLGPSAHDWIDTLAATRTRIWQMLPLGPTGYGDSPYQCFSAFAGNPLLVSPQTLVEEGLLDDADVEQLPQLDDRSVDYGAVIAIKLNLLDIAHERGTGSDLAAEVEAFRSAQAGWLEEFSLFMALKDVHRGQPWWTWEPEIRDRDEAVLDRVRERLADLIKRHVFRQFLFRRQWQNLRSHAASAGITMVGDAPIFVAEDSADVWAHRDLFHLNEDGRPTVVAGVPPDYFSETGQLWGNPLYRWDVHAASGFGWWIDRLRSVFDLVDVIRLDHFRGFAGYWEVAATEETAMNGRWVEGPGSSFLTALADEFGDLPIIAEDLGEITPDVIELRDRFELPGMKILQFAFDSGEESDFLPHKYPVRCVVYTGTHDNDTSRGWFDSAPESDRQFALEYLGTDGADYAWDLIESAWRSRAAWAITTMQDILSLGSEARMNFPSVPSGNWRWRMQSGAFTDELQSRLRSLNERTARSSGI